MAVAFLALIALAAVANPGIWVKRVLGKYSESSDRYRDKGSGAEPAGHLLDSIALGMDVEENNRLASIQERAHSSPIWFTP